jgi:hypothetical protein
VCDSTLDTAAKFILLQNELTKPKNQFFEIQETGIVYNQHYGRIGLGVSFEELGGTLGDLTQLMSLCLHHKNIHPDDSISWIHRLNKLTDLDISFCTIQPRVLTQLIKETIPRLKSLKLMDIKITESELNIIKEQGSMLECLHLFCGFTFRPNNSLIGIVGDTVGNLPSLTELKLYSQGSETLDAIALNLNLRIFQKLYLSTFTKTTCTVGRTSISPCGNRPRGAIRQRRELSGAPITRNGIDHIARCTHLTELRLGSIVLEDESLSTLYRSLCSLEVLELRGCQGNSDSNSSTHSTSNRLLADIDKLTKLKELHLYSITVHVFPIECINNIKSLEYLTLYDSGPFIESSGAVEYWLTEMDKLNIVVLSQLSKPTSLWLTYINLIFSENKTDYHNVIFKRVCRTKTWNVL